MSRVFLDLLDSYGEVAYGRPRSTSENVTVESVDSQHSADEVLSVEVM